MTYSQLFELLKLSGTSAEEFGQLLGISGMTLRRWLGKPGKTAVPRLYVPAIRDACYQLISQGRLQAHEAAVHAVLADSHAHQHGAALSNLGLSEGFSWDGGSQDRVLVGLTQIGSQDRKQNEVNENKSKVFSFRRLGEEWSRRITKLWQVIQSKNLTSMDKLVAYGALFYLLTPIDFIPDQIPFFGLLDDFGVLGIAMAYYAKKGL